MMLKTPLQVDDEEEAEEEEEEEEAKLVVLGGMEGILLPCMDCGSGNVDNDNDGC
jgi:hypothetical protein